MSDGQTKPRLLTPPEATASIPMSKRKVGGQRACDKRIAPTKTIFSLLAFITLLATVSLTYGDTSSEVPDFADKEKWIFVEEGPLIYPAPWAKYEIGTIKKYRHTSDGFLAGFEEFLFGSEKPYWKRWGLEYSWLTYHALRKKDSEGWTVGSPGSYWQAVAVFEGTELKGMWFLLFVPSQEEALGQYFPLSTYFVKEAAQPEKSGASPIRFSQ